MKENSYEDSKKLAVREYLSNHLKFEETELDAMEIKETLTSAKGDHTIYVAFDDINNIKEIHLCMAECQNPELNTRNLFHLAFSIGSWPSVKSAKKLENKTLRSRPRFISVKKI